MDVDSSFWEMAQWTDFQSRQDANWSHVEYFVEKYKQILQYDDYKMEKLFEEFIDFKSLSDSELTSAAWENAIMREDTLWYHSQQLRSSVVNNQRFELLFKLMWLMQVLKGYSVLLIRTSLQVAIGINCTSKGCYPPFSLLRWNGL